MAFTHLERLATSADSSCYARSATLEDVAYLAPRLRPADYRELEGCGHTSAFDALAAGLAPGNQAYCVVNQRDDTPTALFGVAKTPSPDFGAVWMVSTPDLFTPSIFTCVHKRARAWIEEFHAYYPILGNIVHKDNTVHIKWLKRLGFQFHGELELPTGHKFYEFSKTTCVIRQPSP